MPVLVANGFFVFSTLLLLVGCSKSGTAHDRNSDEVAEASPGRVTQTAAHKSGGDLT